MSGWTKQGQLEAQNGMCFYCGREIEGLFRREAGPYTLGVTEHAVPISRGGIDDPRNIVISCQMCNIKKRNMTSGEFIKSLIEEARKSGYRSGYREGINMGARAFNSAFGSVQNAKRRLAKSLKFFEAIEIDMQAIENEANAKIDEQGNEVN